MWTLLSLIPGAGIITTALGGIVSFILSCRTCMIIIGIFVVFIVGDLRGRHEEGLKCKANDIAMQLAATKRDLTVKENDAKFAQEEAAKLTDQNSALNKRVAAYEATLKNVCLLSPTDVKALGGIK